jgi:hypothetical protein
MHQAGAVITSALRSTKQSADTLLKMQRVLENAGIEFIDENGGGPGVHLRKID